MKNDIERYLKAGYFTESDHPEIVKLAGQICINMESDRDKAVALYYYVRDHWQYNPYKIDLRPSALKASDLLNRDYGYCVEKANLLTALARAEGIPARLGFANVRNHLGTARLEKILQTDLLVFHGYTEFFLEGHWVKATPAFNKKLCDLLHVEPLEFDGRSDSQFQQATADGQKFMEYVHDYGSFAELPRELFISELKRHYPHLLETGLEFENGYIRI